ncbi:hypothetical protein ES703_16866 [subsurface metagenome]
MTMKQDIHQLSTIQRYPIGFKYPKTNPLDLRSYRYGRAGNGLQCSSGAHLGFTQDVNFCNVTVDLAAAGKRTLEITVANTDGRLGNGNIGANELAGGYIIIFPDGMGDTINRMIVANTATIGGGVMTITVDKPLTVALSPAPHAECIASPYLDVVYGNYGKQMIVGIPTMAAVAGEYLWLQTWGPTWAAPGGVVWNGPENTLAMFDGSGNIEAFDEADPVVGAHQIAGDIMTPLPAGVSGAPFLFLRITQ